MHNDIPRDEAYLHRLKDALHEQYGITVTEITPAKRGYYGETWQVRGDAGTYFLKVDYLPFHQQRFEQGLHIIDYLCENGIDFVGEIIKTREGRLCFPFETARAGLFVWVEGKNVETDHTKAAEYEMLCKIYALTKPGLGIPTIAFSNDAAVRFYAQWEALKKAPETDANRAVLAVFQRFGEELTRCALQLSRMAERCCGDQSHFYVTHGDAGGNFFIGNGRNYIFDWDEAVYAPIERDAWVMGCHNWAWELFDNTLKENHIPYRLRPERMAFYCYHMYFHYLHEFLMVHPQCDMSQRITEYMEDGWIRSRIRFADTLV